MFTSPDAAAARRFELELDPGHARDLMAHVTRLRRRRVDVGVAHAATRSRSRMVLRLWIGPDVDLAASGLDSWLQRRVWVHDRRA